MRLLAAIALFFAIVPNFPALGSDSTVYSKGDQATMESKVSGNMTIVTLDAPSRNWHCFARRQPWGVVAAECHRGYEGDPAVTLSGFTARSPVQAVLGVRDGRQTITIFTPEGWRPQMTWGELGHLDTVSLKVTRERK